MMDADEAYFKLHGEPLFSSHMIDLSEEPVDWNISTTEKYLKRAAPMKQWLEMVGNTAELDITVLTMVRKLVSLVVRKTV
jgi:fructose/tagatose bisphosphate aldolase